MWLAVRHENGLFVRGELHKWERGEKVFFSMKIQYCNSSLPSPPPYFVLFPGHPDFLAFILFRVPFGHHNGNVMTVEKGVLKEGELSSGRRTGKPLVPLLARAGPAVSTSLRFQPSHRTREAGTSAVTCCYLVSNSSLKGGTLFLLLLCVEADIFLLDLTAWIRSCQSKNSGSVNVSFRSEGHWRCLLKAVVN